MKLSKRIFSLFLMALMVAASLSCAALASDSDATAIHPYIENEEFPGEIGLSKYDPPMNVTFAMDVGLDPIYPPGMDWDNNIWKTEREELLGINVEILWTAEGNDNYNQKLNLSIASQDIPDLFLASSSQFQTLYRADMIADLTDVWDIYATDFLKDQIQFDGAAEAMRQATVDGRLLGIPQLNANPAKHHFVFLREDWRQNLGLPTPDTMEDLYEIAKAFTFDDPDGNGIDDTYSLALGNTLITSYMSINGFANAFSAYPDSWIEKDGEIVYGSIQPEMKNALAELAKWYAEGLIDKEFIVDDNFAASQKITSGKSGIAFAEWWLATWPLPNAYQNGDEWKAYIVPFDESAPENMVRASTKQDGKWVMRKDVEDPSVLIKLLNIYQERIFTPDADLTTYKGDGEYNIYQFNVGGADLGSDKNMEIMKLVTQAIDENDTSVLYTAEQEQVYGYIKAFIDGSPTFEENPQAFANNMLFYNINYGSESLYGLMDKMNVEGMEKIDLFTGDLTDSMIDRKGSLDSLANEVFMDIIIGNEPLDYFDDFVQRWKAEGGDDMTAEVNAWAEERLQ